MLNFTTTTIINSTDSYQVVADAAGNKKFEVKFGPALFVDDKHKPCLVGKAAYTPAVLASAKITTLPTTSGIYRIAMYVRVRNNNNPLLSNQLTFHGKPMYIEFKGGDTAATIVSRVKKYMLNLYGANIFTVKTLAAAEEGGAAGIEIDANDQWTIFLDQDGKASVKVQKLQVVDSAGNVVASGSTSTLPTHEEFVDDTDVTVTTNNGNEAFGDFAHIVKDLRLPTVENTYWNGIALGDLFGGEPNDDKPLPTGKYTQYTVQLTSDRGVLQQTAVGGVATSRTVHVFYVESTAVTDFESKLLEDAGVTDLTAKSATVKPSVV